MQSTSHQEHSTLLTSMAFHSDTCATPDTSANKLTSDERHEHFFASQMFPSWSRTPQENIIRFSKIATPLYGHRHPSGNSSLLPWTTGSSCLLQTSGAKIQIRTRLIFLPLTIHMIHFLTLHCTVPAMRLNILSNIAKMYSDLRGLISPDIFRHLHLSLSSGI